jgi:uncharacterized protein (DUF885 family)
MKILFYSVLALLILTANRVDQDPNDLFKHFLKAFDDGFEAIGIPGSNYDYRQELQAIPNQEHVDRQITFFKRMREQLSEINREHLSDADLLHYDHLEYEMALNLERLGLETAWNKERPSSIPNDGLNTLPKGWYNYRIHFYTSMDISPEALYAFGEAEVARVKKEIDNIQRQIGFAADNAGFYAHLQSDQFFIKDKSEILSNYYRIQKTVKKRVSALFMDSTVTDVDFMEWPGAGSFTPPGYYSPADGNAYGKGIYHFNFYNGRHNRRAMEWLYLHEAIPGHHYQWWMRDQLAEQPSFKRHFYYPGNFEGWATYVEYLGKEMGLYNGPYTELGKWEWDLVRSTRILIDVGIHHLGWSKEEAMACWKKNIAGQDDIAEREVVRCTNWPAQALSYKVGAWKIQQLAERMQAEHPDLFSWPAFHRAFLMTGQTPLQVVEKHICAFMSNRN